MTDHTLILLACFLDRINNDLESLNTSILLVNRLQNVPWRVGRTRLLDHFVDRTLVQIPLLTVSPVLIRYLPLFLRCILPVSETLKL